MTNKQLKHLCYKSQRISLSLSLSLSSGTPKQNIELKLRTYIHTYIHTHIHTYTRTYIQQKCKENRSKKNAHGALYTQKSQPFSYTYTWLFFLVTYTGRNIVHTYTFICTHESALKLYAHRFLVYTVTKVHTCPAGAHRGSCTHKNKGRTYTEAVHNTRTHTLRYTRVYGGKYCWGWRAVVMVTDRQTDMVCVCVCVCI